MSDIQHMSYLPHDAEQRRQDLRATSSVAEVIDFQSGETIHETQVDSVQISHSGATINVRIARPVDLDICEGQHPIIIDPGFLATRKVYDKFAAEIASRQGTPVGYYAVPRNVDMAHTLNFKNLRDPIAMHSSVSYGVTKEILRLYPSSLNTIDYVSHSLGTLGLARFMQIKPEHVNTATIIAGAGLNKHSLPDMACRTAKIACNEITDLVSSMDRLELVEHVSQSILHVLKNPIRTIREGRSAATEDVNTALASVKQANIPIGAIWYNQDSYFPSHEVSDLTKKMFDTTLFTDGNHLEPLNNPASAAIDLLKIIRTLSEQNSTATA